MKITTRTFIEHQNSCKQDVMALKIVQTHMLVPGASTCCTGCSSTSCCCGAISQKVK